MIFFILFVCLLKAHAYESFDRCFTAAVYEHIRLGDDDAWKHSDAKSIIEKNLEVYKHVAQIAANKGAQIIVFPEDAIFKGTTRNDVLPFLEKIPEKMNEVNPCDNAGEFTSRPILLTLSCIAKMNNIYTVANMGEVIPCNRWYSKCPFDGRYQYNTAVAFDNKGNLIAKYHKFNLFDEAYYNAPLKPEHVTFNTPFGKFGIFICFDLQFREPAIVLAEKYDVDTIIFPTLWFDELPFLAAHQFQEGWAIKNKVNLLAANLNKLSDGSTGSGIYNGANGAINYHHNIFNRSANLLIATLSVNSKNNHSKCEHNSLNIPINVAEAHSISTAKEHYQYWKIDFSSFTHFRLEKINDEKEICNNGLCCRVKYSFKFKGNINLYLIVSNRIRIHPVRNWCEEMCAVVAYNEWSNSYSFKSDNVFAFIQLDGNFTTNYVYPSLVSNDLKLISKQEWNYSNDGYFSQIETKTNSPIVTASLYGRCYQRD